MTRMMSPVRVAGAPAIGGLAWSALAAAWLLASCASYLPEQQHLTIGPDPVACADGTPGACLRVTDAAGDIWITGLNEIAGFTYELLVEQPSQVHEMDAPAPPRLALIRVLSKQRAGLSGQALTDRLKQSRWSLTNVEPSDYTKTAWAASGITAEFDLAQGRLSGFAGCNDYSAPLTVAGDRIEIAQPTVTGKRCSSQTTMALEQAYLTRIAKATALAIVGDRLDLSLADGSGMEFHAPTK